MTHDTRFNLEAALFKAADEAFARANDAATRGADGSVAQFEQDGDEAMAKLFRELGPIPWGGQTMADACLAVIGWAAGFEAFLNYVWILEMEPRLPLKTLSTRLLRFLQPPEKTVFLLELKEVVASEEDWHAPLVKLIEKRNSLVHYKERGELLGTMQPSTLSESLHMETLAAWRRHAAKGVARLAELYPNDNLETGFINNQYKLDSTWS